MNIPKILSHDSTWAFVKSSECSTCWVIVEVIWTPRSTTPQQTLNMLRVCTVDKSSAFARGFTLIEVYSNLIHSRSSRTSIVSKCTKFKCWELLLNLKIGLPISHNETELLSHKNHEKDLVSEETQVPFLWLRGPRKCGNKQVDTSQFATMRR